MRKVEYPVGSRFGRLTLIGEGSRTRQPSGQVKRQFLFQCDCGSTITAVIHNVKAGRIKSCGCLAQENRTKHGLSNHPLAKIWYGMHDRCVHNKNYAGRGIKVCQEWSGEQGLATFTTWASTAGYQPGLEIDRENNDSDYTPNNCRFVTASVNQRNKRDALKVTHPHTGQPTSLLSLWEDWGNSSLSWSTVRDRYLYRGWSVTDAISKPKRGSNGN